MKYTTMMEQSKSTLYRMNNVLVVIVVVTLDWFLTMILQLLLEETYVFEKKKFTQMSKKLLSFSLVVSLKC